MKGRIIGITTDVIHVSFGKNSIPKVGTILETTSGSILSLESIIKDQVATTIIIKQVESLTIGEQVSSTKKRIMAPVGKEVLGRVFDVLGKPLDGKPISKLQKYKETNIVNKLEKGFYVKKDVFETGIKAIDFFVPILRGDKIGIFGGAGVGKTLVIKELMNNVDSAKVSSDFVSILTGIGERSREGEELYRELEHSKLIKNVAMFFAQMNETPGARMKIIYPAITAAEYFRDKMKKNVLMFIDNIYRFAQAGSELSSSLSKIPSQSGYQPTLMTEISNVQERLSNSTNGTITSFQTVFVPADDITDPAAVAVFSHLDGSLVLDRKVSASGRYPAIDPLSSASNNIQEKFIGSRHVKALLDVKKHLQKFEDLEDMLSILGTDGISKEDILIINRARKLQNFFTQNFQTAQEFSQKKGDFVTLQEVIDSVERIISGEFDEVAPENFLYIKTVNDIKHLIKKKSEKVELSNKDKKIQAKLEKKALKVQAQKTKKENAK